MKKIVALGAAAALIGGLFAAEPASNPSLVSFTGNASVEWGVDLDAGKTGFKNGTWTEFKIKLFDAGDKATSGDGVWAELVMKVDDQDSCGPNGWQDGSWKSGNNAYIDVAKLHFNNIYVGIKSGDVGVGVFDFNTAIRSADPWYHPGRWLKDIAPAIDDKNFTQGIVAGYEDDNLNIGVDFRSLEDGQYTNAYAMAVEGKLKSSNSFAEGLTVGLGASFNLSDSYYNAGAAVDATKDGYGWANAQDDDGNWYFDPESATIPTWKKLSDGEASNGQIDGEVVEHKKLGHALGYGFNVGYKIKIDDKFYVQPQAGLVGGLVTSDYDGVKTTSNKNTLVAAALFGWGDTNSYGNTGALYFFDDDYGDKAKGITPGVSVLAYIPLPSTETIVTSNPAYTTKATAYNGLQTLIVPSFYLGDLVENLAVAAYSEIGLFRGKDTHTDPAPTATESVSTSYGSAADPDNTSAIAFALGLKYDIKADDITVTPKASIRYANATYMDNYAAINGVIPASDHSVMFKDEDFGTQKKKTDAGKTAFFDGDFFNLEAGVDVAGLINNTTFYGHYKSANLLNNTDYSLFKDAEGNAKKFYNVKLGTFNVGCKIAF